MLIGDTAADRRMSRICETLLGSEPHLCTNTVGVGLSDDSSALVSFHPSRRLRNDMESNGFTYIQEYSILPDRAKPRWLLPVKKSLMLSGLKLYAPYSIKGRFLKSLLSGMIYLGWKGQTRSRVLLASRTPLAFQALVSEITGELQPEFALSLGNEDYYRSLVVQAMCPTGEILGYIKIPLTTAAAELVRNEATVLDHLWERSSSLREHIPRVLYSGEWGNDFILFQSAGPLKPGPQRFGKMHVEFLKLLELVDFVERPAAPFIEDLEKCWNDATPHLDPECQRLGCDALKRAGQLLSERRLRCGLMHGDFAPWNTRQQDNHLFVFDWESARWQVPTNWDIFRFHERTSILLNDQHIRYPEDLTSPTDRGSFLLYCIHSVLEARDPHDRWAGAKADYYKDQLRRSLSLPV